MIPGNDDAIRAVKLIVGKMADAVIEAKQGTVDVDNAEEVEEERRSIILLFGGHDNGYYSSYG